MLSENAVRIEKAVIATLPIDPSEDDIKHLATLQRAVFPVSDEDFTKILTNLHSRYEISMDIGARVVEDHQPWLNTRKVEIIPDYWDRYSKYLVNYENWSPKVVFTLGNVTDEILDFIGDPKKAGEWSRRGLVMGDVQSGKTATYIGLSCKAADAGYKLIILLTGTLESLRRQTQERLDYGFVGLDSSKFLSHQRQTRMIGVGNIDSKRSAIVFTSRTTDFQSDLINRLGLRLRSLNEPSLVVVKKNSRILENLENWLRSYNANVKGQIDIPMLLIDDEADNASVNTSTSEEEPKAINRRIRALLNLFTRSSYVGFTATPFANIFIDPDTDDEMLGEDLFPRDFIYSLETPSNYIGADTIFGQDVEISPYLRIIDDAEKIFTPGHKSGLNVQELPESLEEALDMFLLTNAIRDLRGEGNTHRSMLVNVSRFTNVQNQVATLLSEKLQQIQQDIRNYSQLVPMEACKNNTIASLRKRWDKEFAHLQFKWYEVQLALLKAALPVVVKRVNQSSGPSSLDYAGNKVNGLRVITVGGNSLSRGLTLEGLCVSYFYRNSQMYDTLMQMGRWFGYRSGYDDICRIWMAKNTVNWYQHIAMATRELRNEVRRMQMDNLAPKDYGLQVRAHPDSLIVTARNKMRATHTIKRKVSLSEQGLETPILNANRDIVKANSIVTERFIHNLNNAEFKREKSPWGNSIWYKVNKNYIISLLKEFNVHLLNLSFQSEKIALFLENSSEERLELWDIVIPNGGEIPQIFANIEYRPQKRYAEYRESENTFHISGSSARVGSRGIEKEGIDVEKVKEITPQGKNIADKEYRAIRERPLLLLHFIKPEIDNGISYIEEDILIALGLSFPKFDDPREKQIEYTINAVEWKNYFEYEEDEDVDNAHEII